jgi:transcriptional regulator with XRE-family HTH domain
MTDPTQTAERMKLARQLSGMTQEDAARALDVTVRTYARWERGETKGFLGLLDQIAEVFGTTSDALLGVEPSTNGSGTEDQIAALRSELAELRALLLDPEALRRAADALADEEGERSS